MRISDRAIQRFQQRVQPCTKDEAIARIDTKAVRTAMAIGAPYVKLGTGQRIVIEGDTVVTVLPVEHGPHSLSKAHDRRRGVRC